MIFNSVSKQYEKNQRQSVLKCHRARTSVFNGSVLGRSGIFCSFYGCQGVLFPHPSTHSYILVQCGACSICIVGCICVACELALYCNAVYVVFVVRCIYNIFIVIITRYSQFTGLSKVVSLYWFLDCTRQGSVVQYGVWVHVMHVLV